MTHLVRSICIAIVAVLVLSVIVAGNASAAIFTASETGSIIGHALEPRKFTVNGGAIVCNRVELSGQIKETVQTQQHVNYQYSECKAFGIASVDLSTATSLATSDGTVHLLEPFTVTVTKTILTGECTITYPKQTLKTFDFVSTYKAHIEKTETHETTTPPHGIKSTPTVTGMEYTSSGGICGSSGTNGTLSGALEVTREGGGWLAFDP